MARGAGRRVGAVGISVSRRWRKSNFPGLVALMELLGVSRVAACESQRGGLVRNSRPSNHVPPTVKELVPPRSRHGGVNKKCTY